MPHEPSISDGSRTALLVGCATTLIFAAAITWSYYDTFWYAPDDGAYAHVAQRMLAGEGLNREVQDVHAGYVNVANAAAFHLFGLDLRSLRVLPAVLNVAQALLAFLLLRRWGAILAFSSAVAISSLSFIQFLNPTAHWYCLFLALLIPWVLQTSPQTSAQRVLALGVLVGTIAMFRQLTGAIVAVAVWGWLMLEHSDDQSQDIAPRLSLLALAAGVAAYTLTRADVGGALLFGSFPVLLLLWAARRTTASTIAALRTAGLFLSGILAACLPLIAYHLIQGSVATWLEDVVFAAFEIPNLEFTRHRSFAWFATEAAPQALAWPDPLGGANGLFWLFLIFLPTINGALLWRRLANTPQRVSAPDSLAWLAVFYSLVALHYQIPIYLFYVTGLNAVALAALLREQRWGARTLVSSLLIAASAIGVYSHAGQSLSRSWDDLLSGKRTGQLVACGLPRCNLWVDERDAAPYRAVARRIIELSSERECILALPSDAALYFLTDRCNPTRFFNSALGVRNDSDLERLLSRLRANPPAVLIHRPNDKYNTPLTQQLISGLADLYGPPEVIDQFEIRGLLRNAAGTAK